jgi:zinc/manganese transport system substrate-binding protein
MTSLTTSPTETTDRTARRHRAYVPGVLAILGCALVAASALAACGTTSSSSGSPGTSTVGAGSGTVIQVVAAENFWGSIASQLGGDHVHVVSIITNPNTDPHAYEPTAGDAKALAESQMVIENGIGYDPWVPKLLAADQTTPTLLDVGSLLGVPKGGNPHRWYNPADVQRVVQRIASDYQALDPAASSSFDQSRTHFDEFGLAQYNASIAAIKSRYSGTPVGASESIFAMLAPALGLDLVTPPSFLKAISEGTDVSAADKETIDNQIKNRLIKIYVYNSQNVTPDVQTQLAEATAEHIPVASITETLEPADVSYQQWQTRQLLGIEAALSRSDG